MKRVLRFTRHDAQEEQIRALKDAYGDDVQIVKVSETLPLDSREAVERFDEIANEYDVCELVVNLPLKVAILNFSKFVKDGGVILQPITERTIHDDDSVTFEFVRYEIVEKIEFTTRPLTREW